MDPRLLNYLREKSGLFADDKLEEAQTQAQKTRDIADWASIGKGAVAAISGEKADTSFQDRIRDGADQQVKDLLGRQDGVQSAMKMNDEIMKRDPGSANSQAWRDYLKQKHPELQLDTENLTADEIAQFAKGSNPSGKQDKWVRESVEYKDKNGKTQQRVVLINENTREVQPLMVDGQPVSRGYAPVLVENDYTGGKGLAYRGTSEWNGMFGNPAGGENGAMSDANATKPMPGESAANFQIRLKGQQAFETGLGSKQAAQREDLAEAEGLFATQEATLDELANLYAAARTEGPDGVTSIFEDGVGGVGPIQGRLAGIKGWIGLSGGEATDKFKNLAGMALADYIRSISGTAASDAERAFLQAMQPATTDSPKLLMNKVEQTRSWYRKKIEQKRIATGLLGRGPTQSPSSIPTPPADAQEQQLLKAYKQKYPDKSDEELLRAIRKTRSK